MYVNVSLEAAAVGIIIDTKFEATNASQAVPVFIAGETRCGCVLARDLLPQRDKKRPPNSHQKLLTGAPHVVHAFEHLPVLQKGEKPHVVRALANGVEAGRGLLRTQVPIIVAKLTQGGGVPRPKGREGRRGEERGHAYSRPTSWEQRFEQCG